MAEVATIARPYAEAVFAMADQAGTLAAWSQALARLAALDRDKKLLSRDINMVDLRLPDRVTVRLSDEAAAERLREEKFSVSLLHGVTGSGKTEVYLRAIELALKAGGGVVFLWHNAAPAEIYMGDVGALGIGGALGAVACLMHQPFLLAIVGGVFVLEAVSVLLQVAYFKRTGGQRLFLMTPIHHHFQKKGWAATKVVARFWILSFLFGLVGLLSLKLR